MRLWDRSARLLTALHRLRRVVLVHRRALAVLLVVAAVAAAVRATTAPPEPTVPVVVAARDLPGGSPAVESALDLVALPPHAVPDGAFTHPGELRARLLAAPVRRGEPVTDARLVAPGLLAGYPGLVASPVRLADAGVVRLLAVGDTVDVVATSPDRPRATPVAVAATVLAVPRPGGRTGLDQGGLLVLAVPPETALALAEASVSSVLSVLLTR
jgi:Flp pilus assembly protein CpaB